MKPALPMSWHPEFEAESSPEEFISKLHDWALDDPENAAL
jgi:hypothetical protein